MISVGELVVNCESTPLNFTDVTLVKFVPVMTTGPRILITLPGVSIWVKVVIVGAPAMTKLVKTGFTELALSWSLATRMYPEAAYSGTVTVIVVPSFAMFSMVAATPSAHLPVFAAQPNFTEFTG